MNQSIYKKTLHILMAVVIYSSCVTPGAEEVDEELPIETMEQIEMESQQTDEPEEESQDEIEAQMRKTQDSLQLVNAQLSKQLSNLMAQNNGVQNSLKEEFEEQEDEIKDLEDDLDDYEIELERLQNELDRMRSEVRNRPVAVGAGVTSDLEALYCLSEYFKTDKPASIYRNEEPKELEEDLYQITLEECLKEKQSKKKAWKPKTYYVNVSELPKCKVDTVDPR